MDLIYNYAFKHLISDDKPEQTIGERISDALGEVRISVIKSCYKKALLKSLNSGTYGGDLQNIYDMTLRPSAATFPLYKLITISLKEDIKLINFLEVYQYTIKLNKKYIDEFCYVIEQRGEDINNTYGFHIHILVSLNKKKPKSHLINEFYNYFKRYITAKNYVDVRDIKDDIQKEKVLKYMSGDKPQEKLNKVLIDHEIHKLHGVPSVTICHNKK